jgi:FixJ family two-component response regulator
MADPVLTRAEEEVADGLAKGWSYRRVATHLGIKKGTVYVLAGRIAGKLEAAGLNPNEVKPYQLVFGWARDRRERRQGAA